MYGTMIHKSVCILNIPMIQKPIQTINTNTAIHDILLIKNKQNIVKLPRSLVQILNEVYKITKIKKARSNTSSIMLYCRA